MRPNARTSSLKSGLLEIAALLIRTPSCPETRVAEATLEQELLDREVASSRLFQSATNSCQGQLPLLSHHGCGLARSSRAASQTSFAASRFTSAIARPTIRSGHAERHANAVTSPAATIATLATESRSKKRRAGKECVSTCRYRRPPDH